MFSIFRDERVSTREVVEKAMIHTTRWGSRSNEEDVECIRRALDAVGIPVAIVDFVAGPVTYSYYLQPRNLIDYGKLVKKRDVFAAAFGTDNVRLYIDGRFVVLEVPGGANTVHVADILMNEDFYRSGGLRVAIGKKSTGENVLASIENMPHMLIAGTTGSGKSVFMHQLIISLLVKQDDTQLYLVDPKMVEMPLYRSLRRCTVVSSVDEAVELLDDLCAEMDRRYVLLNRAHCRDIDGYNETARKKMNRKVVFIDELADLMLTSKKAVESSIVRLAQKARACGIHLVIATQRPDRTVVTGLIKANIPVKVCLKVSTTVNSMVVLDRPGGEKLVGKGDMLYIGEGMVDPIRCQGGFISEKEIKNVVRWLGGRI